jgi:lipopolysaccharide export system permease protein
MMLLTRVDRYLARLIFWPMVATLILAAMLLLLDKMLRLFDFVVAEGGPVGIVWRMLANLIPEYLGLGIPIGLMLGVLLAFRKLALSSELDSLRAVGARLWPPAARALSVRDRAGGAQLGDRRLCSAKGPLCL